MVLELVVSAKYSINWILFCLPIFRRAFMRTVLMSKAHKSNKTKTRLSARAWLDAHKWGMSFHNDRGRHIITISSDVSRLSANSNFSGGGDRSQMPHMYVSPLDMPSRIPSGRIVPSRSEQPTEVLKYTNNVLHFLMRGSAHHAPTTQRSNHYHYIQHQHSSNIIQLTGSSDKAAAIRRYIKQRVVHAFLAEWLRRWTRNPMRSARGGSNPALSNILFLLFWFLIILISSSLRIPKTYFLPFFMRIK